MDNSLYIRFDDNKRQYINTLPAIEDIYRTLTQISLRKKISREIGIFLSMQPA